jgi:serine/threonine-protein kinase
MGIRDTLRAKLGSLEDVTIRPVTSDLSDADAIDAGRRMNVDVVVTGSIQRDADRVRVSVEMVDISNERILWGDIFDNRFSNAFELQDSIAIAVVTALKRPRLNGALVDPKWPFVVWKAADIPPRTIRRMMTVPVTDLC